MKVYILIENSSAFVGETSIWIKHNHCRTFRTMQAAINAMRLWKPSSFYSPYKRVFDNETRSRFRSVIYQCMNDDEDEKSYINMSTELEIKTTELE